MFFEIMANPANFITVSLTSYVDLYDFYLTDLTIDNKKHQIECLGKKIEEVVKLSLTSEAYTHKIGEDVACFKSGVWRRGKVLNLNKHYAVVFLTDEGRPTSCSFGQSLLPLHDVNIINLPAIGIIHCSLYGVVPIQDETNEDDKTTVPLQWPESTTRLALKYLYDSTSLEFMKFSLKEADLWTGHVKINTSSEDEIYLADFLVSEKLATFGDNRNPEIATPSKFPLHSMLPTLQPLSLTNSSRFSYVNKFFNKDVKYYAKSDDFKENSASLDNTSGANVTPSNENIQNDVDSQMKTPSVGSASDIGELLSDEDIQDSENSNTKSVSVNKVINITETSNDDNVQENTNSLELSDNDKNKYKNENSNANSISLGNSININEIPTKQNKQNSNNSTVKLETLDSSTSINRKVSDAKKSNKKMHVGQQRAERTLRGLQLDNVNERTILCHGPEKNWNNCVKKVQDANFTPEVHEGLRRLNIQQVFSLQAYAWPLLMYGTSLIMVNPPSSGKTYAYLPSICSLVTYKHEKRITGHGPIGLILGPSSALDSIHMRCIPLIDKETKIIKAPSWREKGLTIDLVNGCDILITTPVSFLKLLNEGNSTNVDRICYLALDGVMDLDNKYINEIQTIIRKIRKVNPRDLQIMTASENWSPQITSLLNIHNPYVLIGDYLEAAVYGNVHFKFELISNNKKGHRVMDIIKSNIKMLRTLIICKSTVETNELSLLLNTQSIDHQVANENMDRQEIQEAYAYWNNRARDFFPILICTESLIFELIITNVYWLIHYSLPDNWSTFRRRYSTMLDNYPKKMGENVTQELNTCQSYLLIDEHNTEQLPRLVTFLERMKCDVTPEIYRIAKEQTIKNQSKLAEDGIPLCEHVQSMGKCIKGLKCKERHLLTPFDKPPLHLPTSGEVKFVVLKVHKANHYLVRLLEHRKPGESSWERIKESLHVEWLMKKYYSSIEQERMHGIPNLRDVCAVKSDNKYLRCQVIQIVSRNQFNEPTKVRVYLMDEGQILEHSVTDLIELPETIQSKPPEVVNIRLSGMKPCDDDDDWTLDAPSKVAEWLRSVEQNNDDYICAEVVLALDNTLWVNKLSVSQDIGTRYISKLSINKNLIESGIAARNPDHMTILYKMCDDAGIELPVRKQAVEAAVLAVPDPIMTRPSPKSKTINVKDNRKYTIATLKILKEERIEFILADSPNEIFVRRYEDDERFKTLELDIQNYIKEEPNKLSILNVNIGDICVAQSPQDFEYHRARIIAINSNSEDKNSSLTAEVFFVDFGDYANVDEIFPIPSKFISAITFQAIECRLIGISVPDDKIDSATDLLYELLPEDVPIFVKTIRVEEQSKSTTGNKYSVVLTTNIDGVINNINSHMLNKDMATSVAIESHFLQPTPIENNLDCPKKNHEIAEKDPFADFWNHCSNIIEMDDNLVFPKLLKDTHLEDQNSKPVNTDNFEPPACGKQSVKESESLSSIHNRKIYNKNTPNAYEQRPSLVPITYTPKVIWEQDEEHIIFKIQLVGIVNYSLFIDTNTIYFKVKLPEKEHAHVVFLNLYGGVVPYKTKHQAKGMYIHIKCVKLFSGKMWRRLTCTNKRPSWLTTECNSYKERNHESDRDRVSKKNSDDSSYSEYETDAESDIDDNLFDCLAD